MSPGLSKIPIPAVSVNDMSPQDDNEQSISPAATTTESPEILPLASDFIPDVNIEECKENQLNEKEVCSNTPRGRKGFYTIIKTAQSCYDFVSCGQSEPGNYNNTDANEIENCHSARKSLMLLKEQQSARIYNAKMPQAEIPKQRAPYQVGTILVTVLFLGILSYYVAAYLNIIDISEAITYPIIKPTKPPTRPPSATGLFVSNKGFLRNLLRIWKNFLKNVLGIII